MKNEYRPKIICVDFDGVLHSYSSGWKGPRDIPDPPNCGAIEWLRQIVTPDRWHIGERFQVHIFSGRSRYWGGRRAMRKWLYMWGLEHEYVESIVFPLRKPPAHVLIDDRAICFDGRWPSKETLDTFKPWYK